MVCNRSRRDIGSFRTVAATLALLVLASVSASAASQRLVIIGGGTKPHTAMARFVEWAGGAKAHVLVISWATEEPKVSLDDMTEQLTPFGVASIEQAPAPPLTVETRAAFL